MSSVMPTLAPESAASVAISSAEDRWTTLFRKLVADPSFMAWAHAAGERMPRDVRERAKLTVVTHVDAWQDETYAPLRFTFGEAARILDGILPIGDRTYNFIADRIRRALHEKQWTEPVQEAPMLDLPDILTEFAFQAKANGTISIVVRGRDNVDITQPLTTMLGPYADIDQAHAQLDILLQLQTARLKAKEQPTPSTSTKSSPRNGLKRFGGPAEERFTIPWNILEVEGAERGVAQQASVLCCQNSLHGPERYLAQVIFLDKPTIEVGPFISRDLAWEQITEICGLG